MLVNNVPEVRRLLSVGAGVNVQDSDGDTPLHWASMKGHVQVVVELLKHGADIEAKEIHGGTLYTAPVLMAMCPLSTNYSAPAIAMAQLLVSSASARVEEEQILKRKTTTATLLYSVPAGTAICPL